MENKIKINGNCQKTSSCQVFCPEEAFYSQESQHYINQQLCTLCGICIDLCPNNAIEQLSSALHLKI